jgi:hypothetical protein
MHRSNSVLFDHLVYAAKKRQRHANAKCLCGFQVNTQLDFGCLLDRQLRRLFTLEDTMLRVRRHVSNVANNGRLAKLFDKSCVAL